MTTTVPDVFRITNYGGQRVQSVRGGYGEEFYAVIDVAPNNFPRAESLGLPKLGQFNPDPLLGYMGTVQWRKCVQELGPLAWIAQIYYSVGGTFNLGIMLGATNETDVERLRVPKIVDNQLVSSDPHVYVMPEPGLVIPRYCITKRLTRRASMSVDDITARATQNLGKIYEFGGIEYQLTGAPAWQDAGGTVRVETRFRNRASVPGYPIDSIGNDVDIPELTPNGDWFPDVSRGLVTVNDPLATLGLGENLPWL